MNVLVAGGTGAVGRRLLPLLISRGHRVIATTSSGAKLNALSALGAEPVVMNGLDREAVDRVVLSVRPDALIHQMTSLASMASLRRFDREFALTNRLRTEGTRHLVAAAHAAGVRRLVAQSYTGWPNERQGGRVKSEDDALDAAPPRSMRETLDAIRNLEHQVLTAPMRGIVLRYGSFYGPGCPLGPGGAVYESVRKRQLPVVGNGAGVWSFVNIDDVALATALATERLDTGIFNIVDDEPVEVAEWLPELARILGSPPPRHVPVWLARFAIGEAGVSMMTSIRGSSNAKARRELGWQPRYPSWREGFRQALHA
jgi:nucleoside-diphosphate-sugar epimerase